MKKFKLSPITSVVILLCGSLTLGASSAYAVGDAALMLPILKQIRDNIPAASNSINKQLNYLYYPNDPLFPSISAQAATAMTQAHNNASALTVNNIKTQMQSMPMKISNAYTNLSLDHRSNIKEALGVTGADNSTDSVADLTVGSPSYDTFFLPPGSCTNMQNCALQPDKKTADKNANNLNFDSFIDSASYQGTDTSQSIKQSPYTTYALQTYAPLTESQSDAVDGAADGSSKANQSFFEALNSKLQNMNPSDANKFLTQSVLNNKDYQDYWLSLRSYEAKRSLLLSNFNLLQSERIPQKGLGTAYGLKVANASPAQVTSSMINNTINNPTWYSKMKTASPGTLQREQLQLTSLLIRIQYHNAQLNERNLATLSLLTDSNLSQSKLNLGMKEMKLKSEILGSDDTSGAAAANYQADSSSDSDQYKRQQQQAQAQQKAQQEQAAAEAKKRAEAAAQQ